MRLGTARIVTVSVWAAIAFLCGGYEALSHFHYVPDPPRDACGLVPADLLDTVLPGHDGGVATHGPETSVDGQYTMCEWNSPDDKLAVVVWHVGFGVHGGPVATAHYLYHGTLIFPGNGFSRYGWPTPSDLGDESAYQYEADTVRFSARTGATVAQVYFTGGRSQQEQLAHNVLAAVLDRT